MELDDKSNKSSRSSSRREDTRKRVNDTPPLNPSDYNSSDDTVIDLDQTPCKDNSGSNLDQLRQQFVQELLDKHLDLQGVKDQFADADQAIRTSPPRADSFWQGAVTGGFLAYVMSFYTAKILAMLASESAGKQAEWAFAPLAGVLHATVGEAIGGGVRATFATYKSPDGTLWANLVSALSDCALATVGGPEKRRRRAQGNLKKAIKNIQESLDKRLGPDKNRSAALAAFGALWRSFVCDELAFIAFAVSYIGSGSLRPTLRRLDNKALSYGGEFGIVLACGLVGGMMTAVLQNKLRKWIQKGEHASGHNDVITRNARLDLLNTTLRQLDRQRHLVDHCWHKYFREVATDNGALTPRGSSNLDEMKHKKDELLKEIASLREVLEEQVGQLNSQRGLAATASAIGNTACTMFCSPATANTPWVGRGAKWRRLLAKSIGNTAVVAAYLYYIQEVASGMHPIYASPAGNHTGVPQPEAPQGHPPYTPIGSSEMAAYAMHGFVLIGAWCTRSVVNTVTEVVALSAVPGLALRVGTTASSIWQWACSTNTPVTVNPAVEPSDQAAPDGNNDTNSDGNDDTADDPGNPDEHRPVPKPHQKADHIIEYSDGDSDGDGDEDSDVDSDDTQSRELPEDQSKFGPAEFQEVIKESSDLVTDIRTIVSFANAQSVEESSLDSDS